MIFFAESAFASKNHFLVRFWGSLLLALCTASSHVGDQVSHTLGILRLEQAVCETECPSLENPESVLASCSPCLTDVSLKIFCPFLDLDQSGHRVVCHEPDCDEGSFWFFVD
jgi:hypothetical protein